MAELVTPSTYLLGFSGINWEGLHAYLEATGQTEFLKSITAAQEQGLSEAEVLSSFYAKVCYASLVVGQNKNVTRVRDIPSNIEACFAAGHSCYDITTDVLTDVGWKSWPNITTDDLLATLSSEGQLVYRRPVRLVAAPYCGRMYCVDSQHVNLLVTPNHRMFVCPGTTLRGRKRRFEDYRCIEASELGFCRHAYIKTANWNHIPAQGETVWSADVMRLLGFSIGDGYLTAGSLHVQFHMRRPRKVLWLKQVVTRLGWELRVLKHDKYAVSLPHNVIRLFHAIYNRKRDKVIPPALITSQSSESLCGLLEGLMQSDGHAGRTGDSFDTTSAVLAGQVQQLCLHVGLAANIAYTIDDNVPEHTPLIRLSILGRALRPTVNRQHRQSDAFGRTYWINDWKGDVYCAEMPHDTLQVLYVRRGGRPVWCGNSVFGHVNANFITTNCSRVMCNELIRNHIGTEYSQTSGRYVRGDNLKLIMDPILKPVRDAFLQLGNDIQKGYLTLCDLMGLNGRVGVARGLNSSRYAENAVTDDEVNNYIATNFPGKNIDNLNFDYKKKVTSALRRLLPNGQSNEIGWSINFRALRHVIQMRTSRHAEWEIRTVFNQVYHLIKDHFPMIFSDAKLEEVDGLLEISGMKTQPYAPTEEEILKTASVEKLQAALQVALAARDNGTE